MKNRKNNYTNIALFVTVIFITIGVISIFTLSKGLYDLVNVENADHSKSASSSDKHAIKLKLNKDVPKDIKLEAVPIQSKEDGKAVKPTEMKVFVSKDGNKKEVTEQGKISKSEKGSFMSWSLPEEKQNLEVSYKRQLEYIVTYSDGQTKMFTHKQ